MNKVILIGRLTRDPELKYGQQGTAICRFTLAVDRPRQKDKADFPTIVCFGKIAEAVANYLKKGSQCAVEGRLQTRSYEAKDGQKRWVTEVVADEVHFLGSRKDAQAPASAQAQSPADAEWGKLGREVKPDDLGAFDHGNDEEIPF